jgi:hypothetical protein
MLSLLNVEFKNVFEQPLNLGNVFILEIVDVSDADAYLSALTLIRSTDASICFIFSSSLPYSLNSHMSIEAIRAKADAILANMKKILPDQKHDFHDIFNNISLGREDGSGDGKIDPLIGFQYSTEADLLQLEKHAAFVFKHFFDTYRCDKNEKRKFYFINGGFNQRQAFGSYWQNDSANIVKPLEGIKDIVLDNILSEINTLPDSSEYDSVILHGAGPLNALLDRNGSLDPFYEPFFRILKAAVLMNGVLTSEQPQILKLPFLSRGDLAPINAAHAPDAYYLLLNYLKDRNIPVFVITNNEVNKNAAFCYEELKYPENASQEVIAAIDAANQAAHDAFILFLFNSVLNIVTTNPKEDHPILYALLDSYYAKGKTRVNKLFDALSADVVWALINGQKLSGKNGFISAQQQTGNSLVMISEKTATTISEMEGEIQSFVSGFRMPVGDGFEHTICRCFVVQHEQARWKFYGQPRI